MTKQTTALISTLLLLSLCMVILGLQQASIKISSGATIKTVNIAIYKNANLTEPLTFIDWGFLSPGETKNQTAYLKSLSTVNTTLSLASELWNPQNASNYITVTWNYTPGYVVLPNASGQVIFFLNVNATITGITSFTFTIDITAVEK